MRLRILPVVISSDAEKYGGILVESLPAVKDSEMERSVDMLGGN